MSKLLMTIFTVVTSFSVLAQVQGTKVSYPTGLRILKQLKNCSDPVWRKYETGLEYVEVKATAEQCQQFSNYVIPTAGQQPPANNRTWGGKTGQKPPAGAVFTGHHYQLINESEIFVQIYNGGISQGELEAEVLFQCQEWVMGLGLPEPSEKLPKECK